MREEKTSKFSLFSQVGSVIQYTENTKRHSNHNLFTKSKNSNLLSQTAIMIIMINKKYNLRKTYF